MEIECTVMDDMLEEIKALRNIGIKYSITKKEALLVNDPESFGILIDMDADFDSYNILHISLTKSAKYLSGCFEKLIFLDGNNFTECIMQFLLYFKPTFPCPFCSSYYYQFEPEFIDDVIRTTAILKICNIEVTNIPNMPLLDTLFEPDELLFDCISPDSFVILEEYKGPILGDGTLKLPSSANFYNAKEQKLKGSISIVEENGFLQESANGDREFMKYANKIGFQNIFEYMIIAYHSQCYSRYEEALESCKCYGYELVIDPEKLLEEEENKLQKWCEKSEKMEKEESSELLSDYEEVYSGESQTGTVTQNEVLAGQREMENQAKQLSAPTSILSFLDFKIEEYKTVQFEQYIGIDSIITFWNYLNQFGTKDAVEEFEENCFAKTKNGQQILLYLAEEYETYQKNVKK